MTAAADSDAEADADADADAEAEALLLLESMKTSSHTDTPCPAHKNYFLQYSKRSLVRDLWSHLIDSNSSLLEGNKTLN